MALRSHPLTVVSQAESRHGVTIADVNAWYGDTPALRSVSLHAPANAITALIGPSGCGKTTLLRSINRLNDLVHGYRLTGTIAIDAADVYNGSMRIEDLRRRVGMLFQRAAPLPMPIFDDVAYGPRVHKLTRSRTELREVVEQSLRRAALWDEVKDRLQHPGRSLSGGQQQRLCLARALAVNPEIMLMDEPCSALDPIATAKIEELLLTLKRDITVVIVTHNMSQAKRVADLTALMLPNEAGGGGEVTEFAPTSVIFSNPANQRTADYVEGRFG